MAKLLEILIQREGIDLVLVEGGTGDVSLDSLRRVAWKKVRQRVSEDFLRQGKITGEEYLQLASDYPFELWGVEDQSLYRQNLNVFLDGASRRENVSKALGQTLIGSKNPFGNFLSTVLVKYKNNNQTGIFGILGPMRMNYSRNLSLVEFIKQKFE